MIHVVCKLNALLYYNPYSVITLCKMFAIDEVPVKSPSRLTAFMLCSFTDTVKHMFLQHDDSAYSVHALT